MCFRAWGRERLASNSEKGPPVHAGGPIDSSENYQLWKNLQLRFQYPFFIMMAKDRKVS